MIKRNLFITSFILVFVAITTIGCGHKFIVLDNPDSVFSAQFSPDGKTVLTSGGGVRIWDATTGKKVQEFEGFCFVNSFSSDGKTILTVDKGEIRIWDVATGKEVQKFEAGAAVWFCEFSPDGKTVLTGGADKTARIWNVATGKEVQKFEEYDRVYSVLLSPDEKTVLTTNGAAPHGFGTCQREKKYKNLKIQA